MLKSPRGDETRPTSDRVREALFSMLEARCGLVEARVLDLYAGTGALGLEALSRGANHATFVERRREALVALRENVDALGVGTQSRILGRAVEMLGSARGGGGGTGTEALGGPFEVIFADPPYADVQSGAAPRALGRVLSDDLLSSEEALFVLEHSSKTPAPSLPKLRCLETRVYGDTQISFYGILPRAIGGGGGGGGRELD